MRGSRVGLTAVSMLAIGCSPAGRPATGPAPPSTSCPEGMVPVARGTFQMGSPDGVGEHNEQPLHAVTLSAYCIDRTEVTVGAYAACVAAKGCTAAPQTAPYIGYSEEGVKQWNLSCNGDDRPTHPINCVDWDQAAGYCRWAGKRLPSEAEWEYAARHDPTSAKDRTYPWGDEAPSARRMNACGTECVAMGRRDLQLDWNAIYEASDGWETTAPVGHFPAGASSIGALDMAGNVWEWTADWYGEYPGAAVTDPQGAKAGTYRLFRGGGWDSDDAVWVRAANRDWVGPAHHSVNLGFRCARGT